MEKWYFESLTFHYSRIFDLIISKRIYFLFHSSFGLCSFIIKVCCFIISLQSSELNFWKILHLCDDFENVNKIYEYYRGELINLVLQKWSTLIGQLTRVLWLAEKNQTKDLRTFLRTLLLCMVTSLGWDKGIFGICTFHIIPFMSLAGYL